jgi:hypothetical protein
MQRRQITLEDGRYLIFYTFEEETAAASASDTAAGDEQSSARGEEPNAEPQATEEQQRV